MQLVMLAANQLAMLASHLAVLKLLLLAAVTNFSSCFAAHKIHRLAGEV